VEADLSGNRRLPLGSQRYGHLYLLPGRGRRCDRSQFPCCLAGSPSLVAAKL